MTLHFLMARMLILFLGVTITANAQAPTSARSPANAGAEVSTRSPAQTVEVLESKKPNSEITQAFEGSEKPWMISLILSPFDQWIPGKYGFSILYKANAFNDYEFEYVRGSFGFSLLGEDLGEVTEQRASVLTRYFINDTFNYFAGVNYDYLEVELQDTFANTVTTSNGEDYTYLELATLGVTLGIGSRWATSSGIDIGVDWIQLQMPLLRLKQYSPFLDLSSDDAKKDDVAEAIRKVRDNPRFAALKFQAGISF